jgi:diguanylate cyclase (GGDEF)-like protein/PAS domain S-box-containing protein
MSSGATRISTASSVFVQYAADGDHLRSGTVAACIVAAFLAAGMVGTAGIPAALALLVLVICVRRGGVSWHVAAVAPGIVVALYLWMLASAHTDAPLHLSHGEEAVFLDVAVTVWALAALDIVRRTQSELELTRLLAERLTGSSGLGVCVLDANGRVEKINAPALATLGWTRDEILGRHFLQEAGGHESSQWQRFAGAAPKVRGALLSAEAREEITVTTRDGQSRRIACTWLPDVRHGRVRGAVLGFRDLTAELEVRASQVKWEERYRALVESLPQAVLVTDAAGLITAHNTRARSLFGRSARELAACTLPGIVAGEARDTIVQAHADALATGGPVTRDLVGLRPDAATFPLGMHSRRLENVEPAAAVHVCWEAPSRDTGEEAATCARVQAAAAAALASASNLADAVGGFLQAVCEQSNWALGVALAHRPGDTVLSRYALWHEDALGRAEITRLLDRHPVRQGVDLGGKAWRSGEPLWVPDTREMTDFARTAELAEAGYHSACALPVRARGQVVMVVELYDRKPRAPQEDLARLLMSLASYLGQSIERARVEQELARQALHDPLTGLPNRVLLLRRLQGTIGASLESSSNLAFLLLDLDRFKDINDTLGHPAGDSLLQEVARRLQSVVRTTDTVARLGGDEFAILLPGCDGLQATQVASTIVASLRRPFSLAEQIVDVGTSIGIAEFPGDGTDTSTLMRHADVAMYAAKRSQAGYSRYSPEIDQHSVERLGLAAELRGALERRQLELYYQPKVNLESGDVESVEALLRWPHPTRGLLMPSEFIPLAEDSGLTHLLTTWVLHEAIRQCRRWKDGGLDLHVAVNLFPQTLHDQRLVEEVRRLLARYDVDPRSLTLEITESAVMADPEGALQTLRRFRESDIRVSIDDFGTGYSSLLYLKRLPVDELKIDKSFILDMATEQDDALIARAVVELGHNLGLQVIAEGVQSQDAWNMLQSIGCDFLQGFYVSEPLPAGELERWLALEPRPTVEFIRHSA